MNDRCKFVNSNKTPTCDWISMFLNESNVPCVNLNGSMPYDLRQGQFEQFQKGEVDVLSVTDIGSRGLDTTRVCVFFVFFYCKILYIYRGSDSIKARRQVFPLTFTGETCPLCPLMESEPRWSYLFIRN